MRTESNPWFWGPVRVPTTDAPKGFIKQLHQLDPDLEVCFNRNKQLWGLWVKAPRVNNIYSQGWQLVFLHHDGKGGYLPLDERLFARVYACDRNRYPSAKAYMDRIITQMEREDEQREKRLTQEAIDQAMPYWDYSQIKVGYGPSNGSKFSTYHA